MTIAGETTNITSPCLSRSNSIGWFWVLSMVIFSLPAKQVFSQVESTSARRAIDSRTKSQHAAPEFGLLVRQLGADDYANRKIAETELRKIGAAAIEPLQNALLSRDPVFDNEIRMRAERLLIEIQREEFRRRVRGFLAAENDDNTDFGLPGWPEFAKIAGNQKVARRMYISMFKAHEQLFRLHDREGSSFDQAFKIASTTGLRKRTNAGRKLDTLNCLMFLSSASIAAQSEAKQTRTPVKINLRTRKLIASQLDRPEMVTYVNSCYNRPEIESLIDYWLRQSADDDLSFVNLRISIVKNYQLFAQTDFLVEVLLADELPVQTRVRAIETLVPLIKPDSVASLLPRLEPLLDEASLVGRFPPSEGGQIQVVEIRDLVLAACVVLSNADPIEFGFQFPQSSTRSFDRTHYGFANGQLRETAISKWREFRSDLPNLPVRAP